MLGPSVPLVFAAHQLAFHLLNFLTCLIVSDPLLVQKLSPTSEVCHGAFNVLLNIIILYIEIPLGVNDLLNIFGLLDSPPPEFICDFLFGFLK